MTITAPDNYLSLKHCQKRVILEKQRFLGLWKTPLRLNSVTWLRLFAHDRTRNNSNKRAPQYNTYCTVLLELARCTVLRVDLLSLYLTDCKQVRAIKDYTQR